MPVLDTTQMWDLARKAVEGKATAAELDLLTDCLQGHQGEDLQMMLDDLLEINDNIQQHPGKYKEAPEKFAAVLEHVLQIDKIKNKGMNTPARTLWYKSRYWYSAAAIVLICGLSVLIAMRVQKGRETVVQKTRLPDQRSTAILPGKNKAILTLSDGRQIILDSVKSGVLADQNGVDIHKIQNGQLIYTENRPGRITNSAPVTFNSVVTPRGGKYQLVLPDGTKVWLNADSRLKFPVRFSGAARVVSMEGEAYFEVAKDARHPFIVHTSRGMDVRVLGTHFNISDYKAQSKVRTTLLEGSVLVRRNKDSLLIAPGQQAIMNGTGQLSRKSHIDLDGVIAWKNGLFYFDQMHIEAIMESLSRWYDITVVYKGAHPTDLFSAVMNRSNDISEILSMLEATEKVRFNISGRTIEVLATNGP